jgi:hypothetical protein
VTLKKVKMTVLFYSVRRGPAPRNPYDQNSPAAQQRNRVKTQSEMWLNARADNLSDSQHFGIDLGGVKTGEIDGQAIVGLNTNENVSAGGIRKGR